MTLDDFVIRALRVPFVDKGRDFKGWDCWGCVRCGLRDVGGLFLPSYDDYSSTADFEQMNQLVNLARPRWIKVENPKPLDVALFNVGGRATHVGLVIDKKNALHAEQKIGTFIESFKGLMWGKRLEGIYRYSYDAADSNVGGDASV